MRLSTARRRGEWNGFNFPIWSKMRRIASNFDAKRNRPDAFDSSIVFNSEGSIDEQLVSVDEANWHEVTREDIFYRFRQVLCCEWNNNNWVIPVLRSWGKQLSTFKFDKIKFWADIFERPGGKNVLDKSFRAFFVLFFYNCTFISRKYYVKYWEVYIYIRNIV